MPSELDLAALRRRVNALPWYHQVDLGNGIVTPGVHPSGSVLAHLALPDLTGKSVLDVGAWDGFFSFAAERLGAARVLATDSYAWNEIDHGSKASFELAREVLGSKVEEREIEVLDIAPETVGRFDVVLFLGVLYHMRHPLMALERVANVTRELLVVETVTRVGLGAGPAMAFYPDDRLAGDETNWWAPNLSGLVEMLHAVGFSRVEAVHRPRGVERLQALASNATLVARSRRRGSARPWRGDLLSTIRVAVHARP
jgi:tRNA (mo5U34)-methyltransferase